MIVDLLKEGKIDEAIKLLKPKSEVAKYAKEYHENARDLRDTQVGKRRDKTSKNEVIKVAKIPIPFQKKIVQSASAFLFGSPVNITSESKKHQDILDIWTKLRMDSILLKFVEIVKSETEAAIVFYSVKKEKEVVLKSRLLTTKSGELLPYFDEYGDLTAFGWRYKTKVDGKDVEMLHLFTDEKHYVFKNSSGWEETDQSEANLFGKIPVVYLAQDKPEWWMVKELIDRFEMNLSKFADTNDYFSSPMYKVKGAVEQLPSKDDTGKMIKLPIIETDQGKIIESDLDVISWDRAPDALKLEFETEKDLIFGLTDTPDLSFDKVKGLGNISGVALKLMFFGSILKAKFDEGDYQVVVNRCLKILLAGMARITKTLTEGEVNEIVFDIQFTSVLPDNLKEIVETLVTANSGKGIISQKTAVENNPLVVDVDAEMKQINNEAKLDIFEPTV